MNLAHGGMRGLVVAAATEVAGTSGGDHAITVAVITASGGVLAVVLTQVFSDRRRQRAIDHVAESAAEHTDLSERLLEQLVVKDAEIITLRKELDRERRRR